MQETMTEINCSLPANIGLPDLCLGQQIGISFGSVFAGYVGTDWRHEYTVMGDEVNLAARLESANKSFGTRVLVAEESLPARHDDEFFARPLGRILVVGKNEPVSVWNLVSRREDALPDQVAAALTLAEGISLFAEREFTEAALRFEKVLQAMPADVPATMYLDLCRQYQATPPGDAFTGAIQLTEK